MPAVTDDELPRGALTGKVGVVVGGASGIGRMVARALAKQGARVVVADFDAARMERTVEELLRLGSADAVLAMPTDVRNESSVRALAGDAIKAMGQVDILVNMAGVVLHGPLDHIKPSDWKWMLETNVLGTVRTTMAVLPHMLERRSGHIVNAVPLGSLVATSPLEVPYDSGYAAVATFTYGLAVLVPTDLLSSIGICVGFAALIAAVTWRFRQPLIIAYLATGVIIGPNIGLKFITNQESISTVAEIGLILLLFVIGLEIDLRKMASGGAAVLLTGALQAPICVALGLAFFYLFGVQNAPHNYELLYLAACMSLSSTLVVVKILNDKFELDTLPGRITLGVLVIQDLWAVGMLAVQPNLLNPNLVPLLGSLWRGALLVVGGFAVAKYVRPHMFRMVAKAPELVLVSALAWCFFLAGAASLIGLSREMGALIAGVSLSTFPYNIDVVAKAVSIRDFFVTLFFVALGMQIQIPSLHALEIALAASVFVIVSRLVVVPILYALRLGLRTSIIPAINLAQVSEFSIVIASLGVTLGQ